MNKKPRLLTFQQLLIAANTQQVELWGPERAQPITERTFRYWVQEGLIPRRGSRGPASTYAPELSLRLLFIRALQKERAFTLNQIRDALEANSDADIERVVKRNDFDSITMAKRPNPLPHAVASESFADMQRPVSHSNKKTRPVGRRENRRQTTTDERSTEAMSDLRMRPRSEALDPMELPNSLRRMNSRMDHISAVIQELSQQVEEIRDVHKLEGDSTHKQREVLESMRELRENQHQLQNQLVENEKLLELLSQDSKRLSQEMHGIEATLGEGLQRLGDVVNQLASALKERDS